MLNVRNERQPAGTELVDQGNDEFLLISQGMETDMPNAWSDKDERQINEIKKFEQKTGFGKEAEEIAVHTDNKSRRLAGQTLSQKTRRFVKPGNPFATRTKAELIDVAKRLQISSSFLSKGELIAAITNRRNRMLVQGAA
jgi:hypothetical protein